MYQGSKLPSISYTGLMMLNSVSLVYYRHHHVKETRVFLMFKKNYFKIHFLKTIEWIVNRDIRVKTSYCLKSNK